MCIYSVYIVYSKLGWGFLGGGGGGVVLLQFNISLGVAPSMGLVVPFAL